VAQSGLGDVSNFLHQFNLLGSRIFEIHTLRQLNPILCPHIADVLIDVSFRLSYGQFYHYTLLLQKRPLFPEKGTSILINM
jgi:hypothetical protein